MIKNDNTQAPIIRPEDAFPLLENRFLKAYDLRYAPGQHYFIASRRDREDLVAAMSPEAVRSMLPDAVTCAVIITDGNGDNARLLLNYEYRYPCGRFLLSPPAGLIDPEDRAEAEPLLTAGRREIMEETGIVVDEAQGDRLFVLSPVLFSSPGMTDESNGIVAAVVRASAERGISVNFDGLCGTELFEGYTLVDDTEAKRILKRGRDEEGNFYSAYTALVLLYFVSGLWR
ncbi:MAG: NUDIX hydrolase [Clostridia bacterium]|nr:NUDIX hydrolase [Clostridia bacterium]